MKRIFGSLFICFALYFFYACGGGGSSTSSTQNPTETPQVLRAPQFINVSSAYLAVYARWSSITGANYYNLYYSSYSSLPLKGNSDVVKVQVFHNFTTINTESAGKYYLTVTAVNSAGEGKESKRREVVTVNSPPPPPPLPGT